MASTSAAGRKFHLIYVATGFDVDVDVDVDLNLDGDDDVDGDGCTLTKGGVYFKQRVALGGRRDPMLSFQRLDVYQRANRVPRARRRRRRRAELPKGHSARADQLVRAAESVVRNIAEGAGRWSEADSAKHYKIARGEAMECAASLDVMKLRKLVSSERYDGGIRLLEGVVAMLTKML